VIAVAEEGIVVRALECGGIVGVVTTFGERQPRGVAWAMPLT
jgi:hypothetical protein